jgi:hypothetical protein
MSQCCLCTNQFYWESAEHKLIAEISELSEGGRVQVFDYIYSDSTDQGFILVSAKTGTYVRCVVEDTIKDEDGDVRYWKLIPVPEDKHHLPPSRRDLTIVIFND